MKRLYELTKEEYQTVIFKNNLGEYHTTGTIENDWAKVKYQFDPSKKQLIVDVDGKWSGIQGTFYNPIAKKFLDNFIGKEGKEFKG